MLKFRYVFFSFGLLAVLFASLLFLLPNLKIETTNKGATFETTVFNHSKVTTVDISLSDSDLESVLANPLKEEVVSADITVNGITVNDVGFRTKGNLTLSSVAQMEDSDRYSWKIDFDYFQDGQNLQGLKKLNLNNNYSDPTSMREYLSYELMEEMGVATPAHSYMYVTINGKEWGLYTGVEAIEETFLKNKFEVANGDLYKPDGTGSDLKWISDDIKDYPGLNLKTNTKTSTGSTFIKMLDIINNGGNLEDVLDVDEMLRYFAANTALVNLDHYQGDKKHNYYLYEENGVFSILPWDYNMSFGGYGMMGGGQRAPVSNELPGDDETGVTAKPGEAGENAKNRNGGGMGGMADMSSNFLNESLINFSITEPVSGTTLEDRPLLNALLENAEYKAQFEGYLEEIANGFFSEKRMTSMTSELAALITPYIEKDPTKFYTTEKFLESTSGDESLTTFTTLRSESILKQLSGELVVEASTASELPGAGGNNDNNQPPEFAEGENDGNRQPPNFNEGDRDKGGAPPNMEGGQFPSNGANQKNGDMGGPFPQQTLDNDKTTKLLPIILLFGILFIAIVIALKFPRRGFFTKR